VSARSFWPPVETAQVDYEKLRAHALEQVVRNGFAKFFVCGVKPLVGRNTRHFQI
jgi:hypothetical protein